MPSYKVFKGENTKGVSYSGSSILKNPFAIPYSIDVEQIAQSIVMGGAGDWTLYSVPSGYTLFITSVFINNAGTGAVGVRPNGTGLRISGFTAGFTTNDFFSVPSIPNSQVSESLSFSFPFIIKSGQSISMVGYDANLQNCAGLTGFLVKNEDISY